MITKSGEFSSTIFGDFSIEIDTDVEAPLKERRCWISTEWTWLNYGPWTTIGFCKSGLLLKAAEGLRKNIYIPYTDLKVTKRHGCFEIKGEKLDRYFLLSVGRMPDFQDLIKEYSSSG